MPDSLIRYFDPAGRIKTGKYLIEAKSKNYSSVFLLFYYFNKQEAEDKLAHLAEQLQMSPFEEFSFFVTTNGQVGKIWAGALWLKKRPDVK